MRARLPLLGACLLLSLGIWVNTGTLAPYGATLEKPFLWEPCNYILNIDHFHFKATFLMLDGAPREQWEFSVVLRRVLYPLLAYPFMKLLGYGAGGLVTNVLIALASLAVFWPALRRRLGAEPPWGLLLLLATYPWYATGDPRRVGLNTGGAVLVRPDGHIGFRTPADSAGLRELDSHLDSYLIPANA